MYEKLGAVVDHGNKTVQFRVFFPDHEKDPNQYFREFIVRDSQGNEIKDDQGNTIINHAGKPDIAGIKIVGDFQQATNHGADWDVASAPSMLQPRPYPDPPEAPKGWLYESAVLPAKDGYFQYRYVVTYKDSSESRQVCDPCSKYHDCDTDGDRSGFVIGGNRWITPVNLANRLPLKDLIIYELHLEDFTWEYRGNEAPLQAMQFADKIQHIKSLGVNAVEILPWTGSPGSGYSWGYMPCLFFAVTNRYTDDKKYPLEKLSQLKALIDALHKEGIHVIMDGVFNHVADPFPYRTMYRDHDLSPFIGDFGEWQFGPDLDYNNRCTQEFILDVCKYWIDVFKVDGIRFDYVKGFCNTSDKAHGLPRLIIDLKDYIAQDPARKNISLILECLSGYECIDRTNQIDADGCWLDNAFWTYFDAVEYKHVNNQVMRALNSNKDFAAGKVPVMYIENHDHRTLINKINNRYYNRSLWWQTQPYMIALFTSPGAILLHSGQEWGEDAWMPEGHEEAASGISRVIHRAIHWFQAGDDFGKPLMHWYSKLAAIRSSHPALSSPNFYPADDYSTQFNDKGYGFHEDKQVVIFHRWDDTERFIIVINFSDKDAVVNVPFPANGPWTDLLNDSVHSVSNYWLPNRTVNRHWGNIFRQTV